MSSKLSRRPSRPIFRAPALRTRDLLGHILGSPELMAAVQALPAPALGKLIDHVGLEDSGEIVALASTQQLLQVFDDDLWQSQKVGQDADFDPQRFLLWIQILLEAGEKEAADRIADMPEDLVTMAFQQLMIVVSEDEVRSISLSMRGQSHQLDKIMSATHYEELEGFFLFARDASGWDSLMSLITSLDRDHHHFLYRVLERCSAMSTELLEDQGGLYHVLTSDSMLAGDMAAEREDRRTQQGFVAPSSAVSFLALARQDVSPQRDPVTRAFFRERSPSPVASAASTGASPSDRSGQESGLRQASSQPTRGEQAPSATPLLQLLQQSRVLETAVDVSPLLLGTGPSRSPAHGLPLARALLKLQKREPERYDARMEELSYLANVLVSGLTLEGKKLRPVEALQLAVSLTNLGLELALKAQQTASGSANPSDVGRSGAGAGMREVAELLSHRTADALFRLAWQTLFLKVQMPAAEKLERMLAHSLETLPDGNLMLAQALRRAHYVVKQSRQKQRPWEALDTLRDLTLFETPPEAFSALLGLLEECPLCTDWLMAWSDGETSPEPATEGLGHQARLIATRRRLAQVRRFLVSVP